jgi:hypothetical protein
MSEQSLPIDALVYRLGESAEDLLHRSESPETSWLLVDRVPDDWNRGARDHPYHEAVGAVHLIM